jgi:hypothetical protein
MVINMIKKIFDKYLLLYAIIVIFIYSTTFSEFSKTFRKTYEISTILLLCLGIIFVLKSAKTNHKNFKSIWGKIIYFLFLILYCFSIFMIGFMIGLMRCKGGCL